MSKKINFDPAANREGLPVLPSNRFRYSVWHDLRENEVFGDQLKAPRIRKGPNDKDSELELLKDLNQRQMHILQQTSRGRRRRDHFECWEEVEQVNLSYQVLAHEYQGSNLSRILARLQSVVRLELMDNSLSKLSHYTFPLCEYLNLANNDLTSFKGLPFTPNLLKLNITDNAIKSLKDIEKYQLLTPRLQVILSAGNPVFFEKGYRQRMFAVFPTLKMLDGVKKLKSDVPVEEAPAGVEVEHEEQADVESVAIPIADDPEDVPAEPPAEGEQPGPSGEQEASAATAAAPMRTEL